MTETPKHSDKGLDIDQEDLQGIMTALKVYQVMAWVVGFLLVALVCFAMPMKYLGNDSRWVMWVGVPHGWLYAVLLITVVNLGLKLKWSVAWYLGIAAAGTIPFLSFYAERKATRYVRRALEHVGE